MRQVQVQLTHEWRGTLRSQETGWGRVTAYAEMCKEHKCLTSFESVENTTDRAFFVH